MASAKPGAAPEPSASAEGVALRRTLFWEGLRLCLSRPAAVAAQGNGLLLLVALQHFEAGGLAKGLVAGASFIGLMAAPAAVALAARLGLSVSGGLALLSLGAAAGLGLAAASPSFGGYLAGLLVGLPLASAVAPLVTVLWRQKLPDAVRGRHFGQLTAWAGLVGIAASFGIAAWLGDSVAGYRPVLLVLALLLAGAGLAASRIHSEPIAATRRNPYRVLAWLWREPRFGMVNLAWTLLGLGNLAVLPLRVEFLAGAGASFGYSPRTVLLLTLVIPQAMGFFATLGFGRLFDRFGFVQLRIAVNVLFGLGILCFFSDSIGMQVAGALLTGAGFGGEAVIWGLWVTQFAPADRTADYMAVHSFLTGLRGLAGPILAYELVARGSVIGVTRIAVLLIAVSALLFLGILRADGRRERRHGG